MNQVLSPKDALFDVLNSAVSQILREIASSYNLDASKLSVSDMFIAKYSAEHGRQRELSPHRDKSQWSFVIALNEDFADGGTYFFGLHELWRSSVGSAVFFHGQHLHAGNTAMLRLQPTLGS